MYGNPKSFCTLFCFIPLRLQNYFFIANTFFIFLTSRFISLALLSQFFSKKETCSLKLRFPKILSKTSEKLHGASQLANKLPSSSCATVNIPSGKLTAVAWTVLRKAVRISHPPKPMDLYVHVKTDANSTSWLSQVLHSIQQMHVMIIWLRQAIFVNQREKYSMTWFEINYIQILYRYNVIVIIENYCILWRRIEMHL